jgi:4-carboxymuconolactone decarboxylase
MSDPRFRRLAPDEMTSLQREVAAEIAAGPRGEVKGPFVALIHHPELARRLQSLGEFLRFGSVLPPALLEMAVLVCARRWTCQHEWHAHERFARRDGLDEHVIAAIRDGRRPEPMTPEQAAVHDFCVAAHATGRPDDPVFDAIRARHGIEGVLELIALSGYYTLMAMVLNTAGMPLPDGAAPPLAPLPANGRAPR